MRNESITSWEMARQFNLSAAVVDRILDKNSTSGLAVDLSRMQPFDAAKIRILDAQVDFIARQQLTRWAPPTRAGFAGLETLRPETNFYYTPRDTDGFFYFRRQHADLFRGIRGLDVGYLTDGPESSHTEYYRRFGAEMVGIDLLLPESAPAQGLYREDIRNLSGALFREAKFKFITVSAVFGEACPSDHILEIAAGLSEINRVLDEDGLAFFAQAYPEPAVWYTALRLGFRVFYNDSNLRKLPQGWFLIKGKHPISSNHFYRVLRQLSKVEFDRPIAADEIAA
jgi:hypothetical protein